MDGLDKADNDLPLATTFKGVRPRAMPVQETLGVGERSPGKSSHIAYTPDSRTGSKSAF
jgi:hypothetical protein